MQSVYDASWSWHMGEQPCPTEIGARVIDPNNDEELEVISIRDGWITLERPHPQPVTCLACDTLGHAVIGKGECWLCPECVEHLEVAAAR